MHLEVIESGRLEYLNKLSQFKDFYLAGGTALALQISHRKIFSRRNSEIKILMIREIQGDITKIEADVIINAANTELIHGGGVARAIAKSAGEELEKESRKIDFVPLGEFAVTTAGQLKAKKVIHIPTIDYKNNKKITYEQLEEVWQKVLEYCRENNLKTIATPLLGTGVVGLDKEKVKEILKKIGEKFEDLEIIIVEK